MEASENWAYERQRPRFARLFNHGRMSEGLLCWIEGRLKMRLGASPKGPAPEADGFSKTSTGWRSNVGQVCKPAAD